jgi:hypothetical protein
MKSVNPATISMERLRGRLAAIWLSGAGLILTVMIAGSLNGLFDKSTQAVWEWLLPMIMPIVGSIVSTLAATALVENASKGEVRRSFALVAEALSIFYLLIILGSIVFKQSISSNTPEWVEKLHTSNLWLSPLQGIVASALGVVFLSKKGKDASPTDGGPGE